MDGDLRLYPLFDAARGDMLIRPFYPLTATPHYISLDQMRDFVGQGTQGPPGATGPSGPPGAEGPQGPAGTAASVTVSDTAPSSPAPGDLWFDSASANLFVHFADPNTSQWVVAVNQPGAQGAAGPAGATGATGPTGATGAAGAANMTGMVAGQIPIAASATTVTASGNLSGDVTTSGSLATTLATVNANTGVFQGLTLDGKGRVTAAANQNYLTTATAASTYAPLASPVFTGTPSLPTGTTGVTQAAATSNTTLATTAYVKSNLPVPLTVPLGGTGATTFPVGANAGTAYALGRNLLTGATTGAVAADPVWGTYSPADGGLVGASANATQYPYIEMSRALGTPASPAAVASGTQLGVIQWDGYAGAGGWQYAKAQVICLSTETWSGSAMGTQVQIVTTNNATTTSKVELAVQNGMTLGAPTGSFKGNGTLNAVSVQANGTVLTSDRRLKRDIHDMPACLPLVQAVEPKAYRWRPLEKPEGGPEDFAQRRRWGFIAQEVEAAARETHTDFAGIEGEEDERGLDVGALLATLWSAVRELSAKVEALEARDGS